MEKVRHLEHLLLASRRTTLVSLMAVMAVLCAVILAARETIRQRIEKQLASRDGEVLSAVVQMEQAALADPSLGLDLREPDNQLNTVLPASRLRSVIGVRLFRPDGIFADAIPASIASTRLAEAELKSMSAGKPVSRFEDDVSLEDVFVYLEEFSETEGRRVPLLTVDLPLSDEQSGALLGIAQFLIEGTSLRGEFAALNRSLWIQSAGMFVVSSSLVALVLWLGHRRVSRLQRDLTERSHSLSEANRELALSARTSAVGAISAHLIHGLKNPLSGLQQFVDGQGQGPDHADWKDASDAARRMQALIAQVVSVLRDDAAAGGIQLSVADVWAGVNSAMEPHARARGVRLEAKVDSPRELDGRAANLVTLILENLVQNALQSTPEGGKVSVTLSDTAANNLRCEVRDEGLGIPAGMAARLFQPVASTRNGGSGIGLAICRQLANHLGATLELEQNSETGCLFVLCVPPAPMAGPAAPAGRRAVHGAIDG